MVDVVFYEKPGCINNTRQKKLLRQAGHTLVEKNLLTENWAQKPDVLRDFFADKPVYDWFNPSAPDIKQGLIDPRSVNQQQAIKLMMGNPLLIRRPLMEVEGKRQSGFDESKVNQWIGLAHVDPNRDLETSLKSSDIPIPHE